jgi:Domain of unknown function (DUF4411)
VAYLLDSNVFIQAKNLHYGFDFCPAFWDWIAERNHDLSVFSVEKVQYELVGGADELADWANVRGEEFFLAPDSGVLSSLSQASQWASAGGYEAVAVSTFLQAGDYYLVAHAHAYGHVVVTHEIAANSTRKIKIPNACIGLGVKCMTPYEMLRVERARFVLGPKQMPPGRERRTPGRRGT